MRQFTSQDFEKAEATYRRALADQPNDWQLHYNFGHLLAEKRDYSAAAEQFGFVVRVLPNVPAPRRKLAAALAKTGKFSEAVAQWRESIRLGAESPWERDALVWLEAQNQTQRSGDHSRASENVFRQLKKFSSPNSISE